MKENTKIFIYLNLLVILESSCYFLPVILFPIEAKNRKIAPIFIGLVLGMITLGSFFVALFLGKNLSKYNKKNLIASSLIVIIISLSLYGLCNFIENNNVFLIFSLISRIIQGYFSGVVLTSSFSYIYELISDKNERKEQVSYLSNSLSFGSIVGPSSASVFYYLTDYAGCFLLFSLVLFIVGIFFIIFFPKHPKSSIFEKKMEKEKNIKFKKIFKNLKFSVTLLFTIIVGTGCFIYTTGYSINLKEDYNLSATTIANIFSITQIFAIIFNIFYTKIKSFSSPNFFILSSIILFFGLVFTGPSTILGIPEELWVCSTGLLLINIAWLVLENSFVPTFFTILSEEFINIEKEESSNFASSLNTIMISLSDFIGPFIAGNFMQIIGFKNGLTYFAFFLFTITFCFFVFNCLFEKQKIKMNSLKENLI